MEKENIYWWNGGHLEKNFKPLFKRVNNEEYKGIAQRIEKARFDLITVQESMQHQYTDRRLEQEKNTL